MFGKNKNIKITEIVCLYLRIPFTLAMFNHDKNEIVNESEPKKFKLAEVPIYQGIAQAILAEKTAFSYFDYVDKLIRETKPNIFNRNTNR